MVNFSKVKLNLIKFFTKIYVNLPKLMSIFGKFTFFYIFENILKIIHNLPKFSKFYFLRYIVKNDSF